jgi:hypothetical protein
MGADKIGELGVVASSSEAGPSLRDCSRDLFIHGIMAPKLDQYCGTIMNGMHMCQVVRIALFSNSCHRSSLRRDLLTRSGTFLTVGCQGPAFPFPQLSLPSVEGRRSTAKLARMRSGTLSLHQRRQLLIIYA